MKSISFKKDFIPLIERGIKKVTRRVDTKLKTGDVACFTEGSGGAKVGYLKIRKISHEPLSRICDYKNPEIKKEGFESLPQFIDAWNEVNGKGDKWGDDPLIYRIEFEYMTNSLGKPGR